MDTRQVDAQTVVGIFQNDLAAKDAIAGLSERGIARDAIGVLAVEGNSGREVAARQGLLTGAALGGVGGVVLEATILSFPPAAVFIVGGTLVAALAGLSIGAGAGAIAGTLLRVGLPHLAARSAESALTAQGGRVLVSVSSPRREVREHARLLMRVQGAIETYDPDDDSTETHFASGFVSVVPELKQHLRERDGDDRHWSKREPQYRYGWQMANRPDFQERSWEDAVSDLRLDWSHRHGAVPWEDAASFVERGWRAGLATAREAAPA